MYEVLANLGQAADLGAGGDDLATRPKVSIIEAKNTRKCLSF